MLREKLHINYKQRNMTTVTLDTAGDKIFESNFSFRIQYIKTVVTTHCRKGEGKKTSENDLYFICFLNLSLCLILSSLCPVSTYLCLFPFSLKQVSLCVSVSFLCLSLCTPFPPLGLSSLFYAPTVFGVELLHYSVFFCLASVYSFG